MQVGNQERAVEGGRVGYPKICRLSVRIIFELKAHEKQVQKGHSDLSFYSRKQEILLPHETRRKETFLLSEVIVKGKRTLYKQILSK